VTRQNSDEQRALRLFRLLKEGAQTDFLKSSVEALVPFADTDDDVEHFLRDVRPWHWPGRDSVDLENLPDPGYWLDEILGEPEIDILFGYCRDQDEATARHMAEQYANEIYPNVELPSAFAEPGEQVDDIALFQDDFQRFLDH
jgi:hypothetical protein